VRWRVPRIILRPLFLAAMATTDPLIGINELEGADLPDYRPLCVPALVGCALGAFSFLALLHPVMWFWPLIALAVNAYALLVLGQSDRMIGRRAALWGLFLSLLFGVAAPLRTGVYQWIQQREAREIGREWFEALLEGNVHKAHQLTTMPGERKPIDAQLPALYEQSADLRTGLDNYLKLPVVATIRALGPRATVRHFQTESTLTDGRSDLVEDAYAVTYEEGGRKKTFFVKLSLWRNLNKDAGPRLWRVQSPEGGYRPKGWG
jgi:hypothetical protein